MLIFRQPFLHFLEITDHEIKKVEGQKKGYKNQGYNGKDEKSEGKSPRVENMVPESCFRRKFKLRIINFKERIL